MPGKRSQSYLKAKSVGTLVHTVARMYVDFSLCKNGCVVKISALSQHAQRY